jgi:hypothetical protein
MMDLLILAAGLAIPFGDPVSTDIEPAEPGRYEAAFEFVESDAGYRLNALLMDVATKTHQSSKLADCATIDIEAFSEGLFGTPVRCNDAVYEFDLQGSSIVVENSATGRTQVIRTLAAGPVVINGVRLLIE